MTAQLPRRNGSRVENVPYFSAYNAAPPIRITGRSGGTNLAPTRPPAEPVAGLTPFCRSLVRYVRRSRLESFGLGGRRRGWYGRDRRRNQKSGGWWPIRNDGRSGPRRPHLACGCLARCGPGLTRRRTWRARRRTWRAILLPWRQPPAARRWRGERRPLTLCRLLPSCLAAVHWPENLPAPRQLRPPVHGSAIDRGCGRRRLRLNHLLFVGHAELANAAPMRGRLPRPYCPGRGLACRFPDLRVRRQSAARPGADFPARLRAPRHGPSSRPWRDAGA